MKRLLAASVAFLLVSSSLEAGLLDRLGFGRSKGTNQPAFSDLGLAGLSQEQVVQGLKEALGKGVQHAVSQLGHDNGFLTNLQVKIPVPEKLQTVERTLRALKQDQVADEFISTMNHAAEQAVPQAASVFGAAVRNLTIADAQAILTGPDDAATRYFRSATETNLYERFLPIVREATGRTGVTASYKRLLNAVSANQYVATLAGLLNLESLDLDAYVTDQALNGLFKMVADEEKSIRQNPVARTTELLQRVFGAVRK